MTHRPPLAITCFAGAEAGEWRVDSNTPVVGAGLARVAHVAVGGADGVWTLNGTASHLRYTTAPERLALRARQEGLGRPGSTRAALIPIRKSEDWWAMAQDERRAIYDAGRHLPIGLDYLPGIARKLYHSRDLGEDFDFLTWFEFAPDQEAAFDQMLERLRACAEWAFVDREIDIRLTRS
ncbi:MAG: hypothetical protein B7Y43_00860 [Sphingomonas sp. 28-62-20]|uniref:chlorite dismutase family protein n=1 Tax=Sphingomonas sp. 28-62-20 TaxID=1970433 RepID=UPI000BC977F7|nr:MAG: hypothetical protein B7Y43_00860 [Sphingomonas sp. 28-62-20]